MRPFDHHGFTAQAGTAVGLGVSAFATALSGVGQAIDAQRTRDQHIINSRILRERSRMVRRRAEVALSTLDARARLRLAVAYAACRNS